MLSYTSIKILSTNSKHNSTATHLNLKQRHCELYTEAVYSLKCMAQLVAHISGQATDWYKYYSYSFCVLSWRTVFEICCFKAVNL